MATPLRANTAGQEVIFGPFVDDTDFTTFENSLTIANTDIQLFKRGATATVSKNSGGGTYITSSDGLYYATMDATDSNTEGELVAHCSVAGALPVRHEFIVYPAQIFDSMILGTDNLDVQVAGMDANTVDASAVADGAIDSGAFAAGAITAAAIATDAVDADALAADAVVEIAAGITIPTAAAIADAVLEELVADHTSVNGSLADVINSLSASSVNVSSGIAYESRVLRRQKIRYNDDNDDNPFIYQRLLNGVKVTPASATIQIFKPGSTTAVLAATAMTIDGTLGKYSIDTTTVADFPVDEGYRARILATISGTVYPDDLYFDVCKHIVNLDIGYDQLLGLDDRISGMAHAGDETFAALVEAVRDEIQLRLETATIDGKPALETMYVDKSRIAIPARFLMLSRIFRSKGHKETADAYMAEFRELWRAMISGVKVDANGDQEENGPGGRSTRTRMEF